MMKNFSLVLSTINGILYLVAIALWLSVPDELWLCLSTTLFSLSLSLFLVFLNWKEVKVLITSLWFKKVTGSLISVFLLFCILALLNYLSFKTPKTWDFNFARLNSLSQQTKQVLDSIDGPVEAIVFASRDQAAPIRALLELFRYEKSDFSISVIDPEVRPDLVQQHGISRPNVISMNYLGRREIVQTLNELNITNGLLRLSREHDPVICFSLGHGEGDLANDGQEGLSYLRELLESTSYGIRQLLLPSLLEVPEECSAFAIIGPELSFRDVELEMIGEYLESGGGLLVALGPNLNEDKFKNFRALLETWGVALSNDLVIDRTNHVSGSNGSIPLVSRFQSGHPIVQNFQGVVFFPLTSSIEQIAQLDGIKYHSLVETTDFPSSWAERDLQSIMEGNIVYNEGDDLPGPVTMMAALEFSETKSRAVIVGNGHMVHNSYANYGMNNLLIMNALSWVAQEERLIAFETAAIKDEPVFINNHQLGLIFYFSVIFLPVLLLLVALIVYRRRSKL